MNIKGHKLLILSFMLIIWVGNYLTVFSQGSAGDNAEHELRNLIDLPTAGVLTNRSIAIDAEILPMGAIISKVELAPLKNFSVGISYGANNFIGNDDIELYKLPGFHIKFRFLTETRTMPSLAIGFISQGKGSYLDSLGRYLSKSPGLFIATSKNYKFLGYLSLHGSMNYSFENKDGDRNINFGIGIEKTLGPFLSAVLEYDLGLNDNSDLSIGNNKGFLNLGLRLSPAKDFTIGFDLKDILDNYKPPFSTEAARSMYIEYILKLW